MNDLKFEKALITGGNGSGGSYMAEHIVQNHLETEVYCTHRGREIPAHLEKVQAKIQRIYCNLNDQKNFQNVLESIRPNVIFHFASDANVRESFDQPEYVYRNNIVYCGINFFGALRELKKYFPNFDPVVVHCSTSEVYGKVLPDEVPVKETQPMRPSSPYGVSKVAQDMMAERYASDYGIKIIRTRMFSYFSHRRKNIFSTAFAMQVARIEAGLQKEVVHGNLDSVRTILDVRDAMSAYWISAQKCRFGEAYNIGGKKIISVGEFLEILKSKAKCAIPSRIDLNLLRPSDVTLQIPDTTKFENETLWTPKHTFEETVEHLLENCRKEAEKEIKQ